MDVPKLSQAERVAVVAAANQAITKHLKAEKSKEAPNDIPAALWGDAIIKLKPVRVRNDRVNVAIVLSENGGVEEGLYVSIPISSYAPRAGDFALLDRLSDENDPSLGHLYHYKIEPKAKAAARANDADLTRPCGTYDIKTLGDHFRVTVETRRLATGHSEVVVTTDGTQGAKDARKPFPKERMRLTVLDGKGGTLLETPIQWSKGDGRLDAGEESSTTLVVAPEMANRLVIMTSPEHVLSSAPFHVVIVGFRSLAD